MAFKKKQQGRTSESDGAAEEAAAPPLPQRSGGKACNGTNSGSNLSFSSSTDGTATSPQPPPIPSRPSTTTSSRSNSITGGGGGAEAGISTSACLPPAASSSVSSSFTRNANPSDSPSRINPFDKNVVAAPVSAGSATEAPSSTSKELPSGSSFDNLIKNRFAQQQGVQDQETGRYKPMLSEGKAAAAAEQSFEDLKNELFRKEEKRPERKWSETDSVFAASPKVDAKLAAQPPFSKFSRTNSTDAEIIFGSTSSGTGPLSGSRPKYNYSVDSQSSFSSEADNIFGRGTDERRSFIKSLSVSSTDDREFSADPRVKNYEGIQNDAFQDYDSSSSSGIGGLGLSGYRSAAATAAAATTTSSVSSSTATSSYKWSSHRVTEEDYDDLK